MDWEFLRTIGRSLVVAHRTELIEQAANKIRLMAPPSVKVGIVKAERDNYAADIVVASVQTLASAVRRNRIKDVHTVVIDECHHAPAGSYMKVLDHYGCFDPGGANAVGFTATMIRGDEKALGDVWPEVVYHRSIADMINGGHLVRPRGLRVRVPDLSLKGVRRTRGDYSDADLGKAIEGSLAPEKVAEAYAKHAPNRQGICFAPTIATAELYAQALRDVGMTAAVIHYRVADGERAKILQDFRDGAVQVLCNAMVLTEGTDLPMADVCVIGRPTLNRGLLIQMAGRVLRPNGPDKTDALILDVSGATERHSLLGAIELFGDEGVDVPVDEDEEPREVAPEDELSFLLDEPTELDAVLDAEEPVFLYGETEAIEVDLFRQSESLWLTTNAGMYFLSTGERYILIQRNPDGRTFDVVRMGKAVGSGSSWVVQGAPDLGFAMMLGEGDVTRDEEMIARKEARWRRGWPSEKASAYARSLGCVITPLMTSGEVSNAITVALASRRIDPYIPDYARPRRMA